MWYRSQITGAKTENKRSDAPKSFEEKILRADAEHAIRRSLRLRGVYTPAKAQVDQYIERVIKHLTDRYGSLNNVRLDMPGESLTPAVQQAVMEILPKKK